MDSNVLALLLKGAQGAPQSMDVTGLSPEMQQELLYKTLSQIGQSLLASNPNRQGYIGQYGQALAAGNNSISNQLLALQQGQQAKDLLDTQNALIKSQAKEHEARAGYYTDVTSMEKGTQQKAREEAERRAAADQAWPQNVADIASDDPTLVPIVRQLLASGPAKGIEFINQRALEQEKASLKPEKPQKVITDKVDRGDRWHVWYSDGSEGEIMKNAVPKSSMETETLKMQRESAVDARAQANAKRRVENILGPNALNPLTGQPNWADKNADGLFNKFYQEELQKLSGTHKAKGKGPASDVSEWQSYLK